MENKIRINLDYNIELVAELYEDEIIVYIEKDGVIHQDICVVRPHQGANFIKEKDSVDCLIWGDENNEDFTNEYWIGIYKEDEE